MSLRLLVFQSGSTSRQRSRLVIGGIGFDLRLDLALRTPVRQVDDQPESILAFSGAYHFAAAQKDWDTAPLRMPMLVGGPAEGTGLGPADVTFGDTAYRLGHAGLRKTGDLRDPRFITCPRIGGEDVERRFWPYGSGWAQDVFALAGFRTPLQTVC